MNHLSETLRDLPWTGLIPVAGLVLTGLLLWMAGHKILRMGFGVVGLIAGGLAGWLAGESMNLGVPSWVTAIIGAGLCALIAAMAFRFAVMLAMAMILAIAAPLGVLAVAEVQAHRAGKSISDGEVHNPVTDKINDLSNSEEVAKAKEKVAEAAKAAGEKARETLDRAKDALSEKLGDETNEHLEVLERYGQRLVESIRQEWDKAPEGLRPTMSVAAVVGILLGLVLGFVAQKFSAVFVTAVGGSLLWLTGLRIVLARLGLPEGSWLPSSGTAWLCVWAVASLLGCGIQWISRRRQADKTA